MQDIVELAKAAVGWGTRVLHVPGLIVLAVFIVDRGRKAAAIELAEERKDRRAA